MMRLALLILPLLAAPALGDERFALPSGREVALFDTIPDGSALRVRFIEADLAEVLLARPYAELEADMRYLCETVVLERLAEIGNGEASVIVSIGDRPVAFGDTDSEATQVFESYRPEDGACIWELF